jgi:hypothetical protein
LWGEEWIPILTFVNTLIVAIGIVIALRELRVISKTQQIEALREFLRDLNDTEEDRKFLYEEFEFSLESPEPLQPEEERRIQKVINCFNRIGLLVENGLLPSRLVFSICHTEIIRSVFKLKEYMKYRESRIGSRYGRRLLRLDKRAKIYHDVNPYHRKTKVMIDPGPGKTPYVIYETKQEKGLKKVKQEIIWAIRRCFRIY